MIKGEIIHLKSHWKLWLWGDLAKITISWDTFNLPLLNVGFQNVLNVLNHL